MKHPIVIPGTSYTRVVPFESIRAKSQFFRAPVTFATASGGSVWQARHWAGPSKVRNEGYDAMDTDATRRISQDASLTLALGSGLSGSGKSGLDRPRCVGLGTRDGHPRASVVIGRPDARPVHASRLRRHPYRAHRRQRPHSRWQVRRLETRESSRRSMDDRYDFTWRNLHSDTVQYIFTQKRRLATEPKASCVLSRSESVDVLSDYFHGLGISGTVYPVSCDGKIPRASGRRVRGARCLTSSGPNVRRG